MFRVDEILVVYGFREFKLQLLGWNPRASNHSYNVVNKSRFLKQGRGEINSNLDIEAE